MIGGIVLAVDRPGRSGRSTASLTFEGETFLQRAIRTLEAGGCQEIAAVLDPDAGGEGVAAEGSPRTRWARGVGPGTIDALRAGLRSLSSDAAAVVVLPVDHPRVQAETVQTLIESFRDDPAPILVACHEGRRGRPLLFGAALFDELLHGEHPEGLRSVLEAHAGEVRKVEVGDPGVLFAVETPDDYRRLLAGRDSV